jgi:hypothetical protein
MFLDSDLVPIRQLAIRITLVANLLHFFADFIPGGGIQEILEELLDVVVRKKLVQSVIMGVPVRFVSKFGQFFVDAFNNNIIIISHVALAHLDDPGIPAIEGVIHPTFTRRWHKICAMKPPEVFTELLQFVH